MKTSTRSAPNPTSPVQEVVCDDCYSNLLKAENTFTCDSVVSASKKWDPVQEGTGETDANGNEIQEYVDYDAVGPITGKVNIKDISNNYYRDYQTFFARGGVKCTEESAKAYQTKIGADGSGTSEHATPYSQILFYRSQLLSEIAQSLDQENSIDTVAQDYQIAWSCGGLCQEIGSQSINNSCRPVYATELIFGLQDEANYYSSLDSSPTTFPSQILTNIQSYYANNCSSPYGCYSSRSKGKTFSPLSKNIYALMFDQFNYIPKGNVNTKVAVTNYNCTDSNGNPSCPVVKYVNRPLPNAASANANQNLSFLIYDTQPSLPNPSYCDNVQINTQAIDHTPDTDLPLSAAFFKRVLAGNSLEKKIDFKLTSTVNSQGLDNAKIAEMAFFNLIPYSQTELLKDKAFSSTSDQNTPPDVGFRAESAYKQVQSLLNPYSLF